MSQGWSAQPVNQNNCTTESCSTIEKPFVQKDSKISVSKDLAAAAGFNVETPIVSAIIGNITGTLPLKKNETAETLKCKVCDCEVSSSTILEVHNNGSKHRKKLKALDIIAQLKQEKGIRVGDKDNPNNFKCEVCHVTVNSAQQLEFHLSGAKHKKRVNILEISDTADFRDTLNSEIDVPPSPKKKKKKEEQLLECVICNVFLNSQIQYDQHLISRKHKLKLHSSRQNAKKFQALSGYSKFVKSKNVNIQNYNFQRENDSETKFKRHFPPYYNSINTCF